MSDTDAGRARAGGVGPRDLDLVTMGCTYVLDLSALDDPTATQLERRWQRCAELAADPDSLRLDADDMTVRVGVGALPERRDPADLLVSAASPDRLPYVLSREITRAGLTRMRGRATLLHAAALADEQGRTLALVAASGGGKSTATSVLGTRLGYVSDESVVLLPDGRIAPHPKPPSLVIDPGDRFHKREPAPDDVGLGPTPRSPRLTALLTLSRDASVIEPTIEPVGLIDQVLAVLPETSSTWWLDDGLDQLARAVTAGGAPARLSYAEIDTCHDLVRDHLARATPVAPVWEHLPATGEQRLGRDEPAERPGPAEADHPDLAEGDRLERAPWSDAIACDGEVLVLSGARPLRLAGPGAVIWRAATAPTTLAELAEAVLDDLGPHPQALDLVRDAAARLLEHGVLRRI